MEPTGNANGRDLSGISMPLSDPLRIGPEGHTAITVSQELQLHERMIWAEQSDNS